ncbi:helix-turn-helix domain-containing protein [Nocardiopsis sp. YSL2]|uniref:helix-turn-helix domain-containing protein n=1 Tax=Nocardiopsis sp. YSL2 TaxID=2939492 RepID=UPI0026F44BEB|nr:helix-turn-helix domain-containing protein [Nocardiopsis sp. YSL2]
MATIGHTLAAARIAAGYTVADLSTRTRIRERVLKGIEAEDFVPCGGDFYARGHIRGICRALGLDPDPLLAEYERDHADKAKLAFVPLQRHPAAAPEAARAIAAARAAARGSDDDTMAGPLRVGDDGEDPADAAERWGHFERRRHVDRPVRGRAPRGKAQRGKAQQGKAQQGKAPSGGVPAPRVGRHSAQYRERTAAAETATGVRTASRDAERPRPGTRAADRTRRRPAEAVRRHWPWAVVGVILVLAVFVGVRAWQGWEGELPLRSAVESGSVVGPAQDGGGAAHASVADVPALEPPTEFTVGVAASDRTWLKVTDTDGTDLFTGFLLAGQSQEYVSDDTLTLRVGHAGALRVSVDGRDLGAAGSSGAVKEVTVDADGFTG